MKKHVEKTILPYKQSNAKKKLKSESSIPLNEYWISCDIFRSDTIAGVLYNAAFDHAFETISAAMKLISENI